MSIDNVEAMLIHVDFNRGETWEYCVDAESMASGNNMDAGRKGMSDLYYRWSKFSQPMRHLRVDQRSDGQPMSLLTAFGPKLEIKTEGNVYHGSTDGKRWTALVGPGATDGLVSDAHFALAVQDDKADRAEVYRFGGSQLSLRGTKIESASSDVFAVLQGGKIVLTR